MSREKLKTELLTYKNFECKAYPENEIDGFKTHIEEIASIYIEGGWFEIFMEMCDFRNVKLFTVNGIDEYRRYTCIIKNTFLYLVDTPNSIVSRHITPIAISEDMGTVYLFCHIRKRIFLLNIKEIIDVYMDFIDTSPDDHIKSIYRYFWFTWFTINFFGSRSIYMDEQKRATHACKRFINNSLKVIMFITTIAIIIWVIIKKVKK